MQSIIELQTPRQPDCDIDSMVEERLDDFDAVLLAESGGIDVVTAAQKLRQSWGKPIFLKISCRDRNRIALHSQLLTAATSNLTDIALIDGIHPKLTVFPAAKPIYELDSLNLLRMLKQGSPAFAEGLDFSLSSITWRICVSVGGSTSADMARARKFEDAGADLFLTSSLECVAALKQLTDKPIFMSVHEEAGDTSDMLSQAQTAGASGIHVITNAQAFDGTTARKRE